MEDNQINGLRVKSLDSRFEEVYRELRLRIYRHMFGVMAQDKTSSLTATEYFVVETIALLGTPTVTEFKDALNITSPLASYKVRTLLSKGFIEKIPTEDKRSFRLKVTDRFYECYQVDNWHGKCITDALLTHMTESEIYAFSQLFEKFAKALTGNKGERND